ncbi:hypothetical protein BDQ17DRAFT_1411394, partial [Cyathus striatus]
MDTLNLQPSVFLRNSSCLAALVVQILDHVSTFQFECECIWRWSLTTVKFFYICSRYLGLIIQIVNVALLFTKLYDAPINPSLCRYWFTFLISSVVVLGTFLHVIVMLRVYALYRKDFKVGTLLATLLVGVNGLCVHAWWLCYPHTRYDAVCSLEDIPSSLLRFGICVIAEELIVLILTLAKIATQYVHIVGRVVRDGGGVFVFMVATAIPLILPSLKAVRSTFATFSLVWTLTIVPIVTCR